MGYAARQNPNSKWNRNRSASVVNQASTPVKDEPVVIKINPINVLDLAKDLLCRTINILKSKPRINPQPTN